ncbi:hypothetical protein JCM10213_004936 [Rhodosporidiobolus nylandii]
MAAPNPPPAASSDMECTQCGHKASGLSGAAQMNRCSACKAVFYCSAEHQKVHKPACASRSTSKPYILHIDFHRETTDSAPWCKPLLDSLSLPFSRTYAIATSPAQALNVLAHPIAPKCILCTSGEIADVECAELRSQLRKYIEHGGRLVLGGPIANFLHLGKVNSMFADFGAPEWAYAGYHRTTHSLNAGHPLYAALPGSSTARAALPSSYSCKSVFLKNVPREEALYQTTSTSRPESLVPLPGNVVRDDEVAVAAKKVGEGWFAWVGDVNQENGSTMATLVLLGVKE